MPRAPRVLVVEAEATLGVRTRLAAAGFEPVVAQSGDSALRSLEQDPPDAVLLDLDLPVLDGWYVLARVGMRVPRPPVVVRTPDGDPAARRRALRLGADAVLDRRAEHQAVVDAIARLVCTRSS